MILDTAPCFCFICGTKLEEIGLGWLQCNSEKCGKVFFPFKDLEGNQSLMMQKSINIKKSKKNER